MNGLQAIKDRILDTARQKAQDYEYATEKQIREILDAAEKNVEQIRNQSKDQAQIEVESIRNRAHSLAISEKRKMLLASKQEQIGDVIQRAVDSLVNIPPDQKIALYDTMLKTVADWTQGAVVQFNRYDISIVDELLLRHKQISLHPEPGLFLGGFILMKNNMEMNMTFDMIVSQYKNELSAIAADVLFR